MSRPDVLRRFRRLEAAAGRGAAIHGLEEGPWAVREGGRWAGRLEESFWAAGALMADGAAVAEALSSDRELAPRAPRRLTGVPAATACLLTMPPRSKIRWPESASDMLCISIYRRALNPARSEL